MTINCNALTNLLTNKEITINKVKFKLISANYEYYPEEEILKNCFPTGYGYQIVHPGSTYAFFLTVAKPYAFIKAEPIHKNKSNDEVNIPVPKLYSDSEVIYYLNYNACVPFKGEFRSEVVLAGIINKIPSNLNKVAKEVYSLFKYYDMNETITNNVLYGIISLKNNGLGDLYYIKCNFDEGNFSKLPHPFIVIVPKDLAAINQGLMYMKNFPLFENYFSKNFGVRSGVLLIKKIKDDDELPISYYLADHYVNNLNSLKWTNKLSIEDVKSCIEKTYGAKITKEGSYYKMSFDNIGVISEADFIVEIYPGVKPFPGF